MRKITTEELVFAKLPLEEFKKLPKSPITVVVDGIRSLDNVGLIFRICDGFHVKKLYLCGITGYPAVENDNRPPHIIERQDRRINKTAIKTISYMDWEYRESVDDVLAERKKEGDSIIILEQTDCSENYQKVEYSFPLTLVVGHERTGVSDGILKMADKIIEIPMYGMGNSHNVAVSTAIVLSHIKSVEI
jgi:tRNA G18 (ribose-2'-O)-methylase SpoU